MQAWTLSEHLKSSFFIKTCQLPGLVALLCRGLCRDLYIHNFLLILRVDKLCRLHWPLSRIDVLLYGIRAKVVAPPKMVRQLSGSIEQRVFFAALGLGICIEKRTMALNPCTVSVGGQHMTIVTVPCFIWLAISASMGTRNWCPAVIFPVLLERPFANNSDIAADEGFLVRTIGKDGCQQV
jgi:hypothetical protein